MSMYTNDIIIYSALVQETNETRHHGWKGQFINKTDKTYYVHML